MGRGGTNNNSNGLTRPANWNSYFSDVAIASIGDVFGLIAEQSHRLCELHGIEDYVAHNFGLPCSLRYWGEVETDKDELDINMALAFADDNGAGSTWYQYFWSSVGRDGENAYNNGHPRNDASSQDGVSDVLKKLDKGRPQYIDINGKNQGNSVKETSRQFQSLQGI